jgi:peptide/nickel transport system substrate-binding protein
MYNYLKTILFLALVGAFVLASCAPPTPIIEEIEVVKTVEVEKEVVKTIEVEIEGETVVITATPEPTAEPEALPGLGKELIGDIQGPTIITDPSKFPTEFQESPKLSILVGSGKLPSVEERLPKEPLVLEPLEQIGTYGGTWHRGFTGPADFENAARIFASEKLIFSNPEGTEAAPSLAKGWEMSEDGTEFTIYLREGTRWSDGEPFTTADVLFWYEDIYQNPDLTPTPTADLSVDGEPAELVIVDDYTFKWIFSKPKFLFEELVFGDTHASGGIARWAVWGLYYNTYAPSHYLSQFLPKYSSEAELNAIAKEAGFDGWITYFKNRFNYALNPELPIMAPWVTKTPINTSTWVLERNPYYFAVDTAGNQLPYIDEIIMSLAEDLEVLNLRAVAGEYDFMSRHVQLDKLPVFLENREVGDYKVTLNTDPCSAVNIQFNFTYEDEDVADLIRNADFRRALSIAINRDQFNETYFLGLGTPSSNVIDVDDPTNPGQEYNDLWANYDPEKANELLDSIGLDQKDSEGYRLLPSGERLQLEVQAWAASFQPYDKMLEMVKEQWKEIGIYMNPAAMERSLAVARSQSNEWMMEMGSSNSCSSFWMTPYSHMPHTYEGASGSPWYKYWATDGLEGEEPTIPHLSEAMQMYKGASSMTAEERLEAVHQITKWMAEDVWLIGFVVNTPADFSINITSNCLVNVPERFSKIRSARIPGGGHPETWFFNCP